MRCKRTHERHPRQTSYARAPQKLQQYRFGLIVQIVRQRDIVRAPRAERRVARVSRRGFRAVAACDVDFDDGTFHAALAAARPAEPRPRSRVRGKLMIHVQRLQLEAHARREAREHIQEHDGIDAAAQADDDALAGQHHAFQRGSNVRDEAFRRATGLRLL